MQPRWKHPGKAAICLGGTAKMDIFVHSADLTDLRLCWGTMSSCWHWACLEGGKLRLYTTRPDELRDPPTYAELEEAWTYIKLFAPDVADAMERAYATPVE